MDLSIFFAGTAGSVPTPRRGLPAILVRRGADRILFDCGEGTQRQLVGSVGLADLTEIFLTHFHADHWLGLPGMLKTFDLRGRDRPLTVYGPAGLRALMALVLRMGGSVGYELQAVELQAGDVLERDGYRIAPVPVSHRGPALGYVLYEDERPGVFDPGTARRLGLREGPEFGRVQRGETVRGVSPGQVLGPARPGRKLVLSGDTRPCEALRVAAHRADVLVHEATFAEEERERADDNGHSTAREAATLAREAEVGLLALNHVSMRHPIGLLRDEARAVFGATVVPRDFDTIEIPLPERGEPGLVRWSESPSGWPGSRRRRGHDRDRPGSRAHPPRRPAVKALAPTELGTPRMRGEPLGPEHEAEMTDLTLDPRVYRTLWPWSSPPTRQDVRISLLDKRDHWRRHGFGLWLLRDRATGELVGRGGLQYTDAVGGYAVEAAWAIVPERWGQGLATELAEASVAVGFGTLGLDEIIAITLPDNIASRRVMEKAGFVYDRAVTHVDLAHALYRRRPD